MSTDWSTLSPREVWDALKRLQSEIDAAPKIAGPWCRASSPAFNSHTYEWRSKPLGGNAVWVGPDDRSWRDDPDGSLGYFDTRAEADEALRADGWLLLDEPATTYHEDSRPEELWGVHIHTARGYESWSHDPSGARFFSGTKAQAEAQAEEQRNLGDRGFFYEARPLPKDFQPA